MVMKAMQQLLHEVDWGGLDVLVLDLPPGTGDTQLTITQQVHLNGETKWIEFPQQSVIQYANWQPLGAVIVSTPHTLAIRDAVKGINMFKKVDVDILGLVQNMSLFTCPHCHTDTAVFGANERVTVMCQENGIDLLGEIPLHPAIGDDADRGKPTVVAEPESGRAAAFMGLARTIASKIGLAGS